MCLGNKAITVSLVANAGVFIESNGIGLLVDGIHHEEGHPFSVVSDVDLQLMRTRSGRFSALDYLLFTHEHPDHFTPQLVLQHIYSVPVKGIILPGEEDGSRHLARLLRHVRKQAIPHWSLGLEPGTCKTIELDTTLRVSVLTTPHMGPQYQHIKNNCFLITLAGKKLLFTGDADYVPEYFEALASQEIDLVFVNPLFYHHAKGQEIINDILRPHHLIIYHLPFPKDETMRITAMALRDMERLKQPNIHSLIFNQEEQSFILSLIEK